MHTLTIVRSGRASKNHLVEKMFLRASNINPGHLPGRPVTTAEKRAELEALGEPWPTCECHDEPMGWMAEKNQEGRFRCLVLLRERTRQRREQRRLSQTCIHCGGPLATETMCQKHADTHADVMAQPKHKLNHLFAQARYRRNRRAKEGYESTGVGVIALALWREKHGQV